MKDSIITKEILRRFLVATGWREVPREGHPRDPAWERREGERALGISAGLPMLNAIAAFDGMPERLLVERLTLCAAAEEIALGRLNELAANKALGSVAQGMSVDACETIYLRCLRAAGVDYRLWWEARNA